jgi:tetratricopeptide (TPR) repeat protein
MPRAEGRRSGRLPAPVLDELSGSTGRPQARRLEQRLSDAAAAYEHDRYADAARMLRALVNAAPDSPSVRELYGLTLYRQGRWGAAIRQLDAYHRLTGSYDQHPVLADCHRALGHVRAMDEVWDDLRQASPSAEVVAEGRLVVAGARADQGDIRGALALLQRASHDVRRPRPHHVRQWYALADLYERSGDIPRARELFRRVLRHDAHLSDAADRLAALG